ncbi:MAG: phosphatase PAP2 family protein [Chlorobiaceae bacterium]|nr:phosphatase PAP2 family protein [Chlorobiaceae bacterium]
MQDFLYSIDLNLFYFFNHTLSNKLFDRFFSQITQVDNWFIAYIILIGILFFKGGTRGKIATLMIILLITASDQTGLLIKNFFERVRPCNALTDALLPIGCTGAYSFPSNHALNNFAAAFFFYKLYPNLKYVLFISAFLISFSRLYLGLHYPSDSIAGAMLGIGIGYLFVLLQLRIEKYFENRGNKKPTS